MKFISKIYTVSLVVLAMLVIPGCTDLEEELFSDLTSDNFFQSDEELSAALGQAYSAFGSLGNHFNIYTANELSSDEQVICQKGGDWFDGGVLIQLHRHQVTPDNGIMNSAWGVMYNGINTANRLIAQFEGIGTESALAVIPELRAIRAFWYLMALDNFGNVPLVIAFTDDVPSNNSDFQTGRTEVFNFVESELTSVLPSLRSGVGGGDYAKFNQATAHAALVELYLNAEVYTGTARWSDVVTQAEAVEGFGYSLEPDYKANFAIDNEGSSENIFVVPYDKVFLGGFNWPMMNNSTAAQAMFQFTAQPWNGYQTVEEFYNSYVDPVNNPGPQGDVWTGLATAPTQGTQDDRLRNFVVGPQFRLDNGAPVEDPGFEGPDAGTPDPDGINLVHTPQHNELEPNGWRQAGARNQKYTFEIGGTPNMSNDFVVYRYGETQLAKAEALWRMDNGSAEALTIVNSIRARAGVDPYAALTEDNLLAERGREMFAEISRRQDLIRFGRFGDAWWEKDASTSQYEVFPIPQPQIDVNASLTQNPGY